MTEHLMLLNPPGRMPFWTPWACVCGKGSGYAGNVQGAEIQFRFHTLGLQAFIEPVPGTECQVLDVGDGPKAYWVRPE